MQEGNCQIVKNIYEPENAVCILWKNVWKTDDFLLKM